MKQPKVIVSVITDLNTDQRVHKVCVFLQEQGYQVLLIGRQLKSSAPMELRSYATKRLRMIFQKGALFYAFFNLRLFFILLFSRYDRLVANDLDTLLANYLASKIRKKQLSYDSHEFFTEVPELIKRPKIRAIWLRIEEWIFPKLTQVYTVNHSIAKKYSEKYGVNVQVLRNVAPLWTAKNLATKKELGLPENKKILIMQGAGLNIDRGVEEAIRMMPFIENTVLILVGSGDCIPEMKQLVLENNWTDRVLFFGKRPYQELLKFTFHADLGLSFDQPTNPNYQFSLPNKIFDYIHSGTPILCSDVIEVSTLIHRYNIGKVIVDYDPQTLAKTIDAILSNEPLLNQWKENCVLAAQHENWEKESRVLEQFYPKIND